MIKKIPFALPDISHEEIDEVIQTLKNGWLTYGPKTIRFEENFKNFIGCSHTIAVNSATSGLHLALLSLGIGVGDKVVVPVNTFTSTANAVIYSGATPLFCDIDPKTFNIDTLKLKEILLSDKESKIKAVIPVHVGGQAADLNPIIELKKLFGFYIVEDAAHALPATYNNKMIGTIGDITVFSFYPTKTLGTCEGGMVCTENEQWAKRIKLLMHNGIDHDVWERNSAAKLLPWQYDVQELGYKYNMNDIAASIAIHQLIKAGTFLKKREAISNYYDDNFKNSEAIDIPFIRNPNDIHARHLYIIKIPNRDEMARKLIDQGIMTSVHFKPLHLHSFWREKFKFKDLDFPNSLGVYEEALSLPIHTKLSDNDVEHIVKAIKKNLN